MISKFNWRQYVHGRKKLKKDMQEIRNFSYLFKGEVVTYANKSDLLPLFPLEDWIKKDNVKREACLWEREESREILRMIAVEGKSGINFECTPTHIIHVKKNVDQYIWKLRYGVNEKMKGSVQLLVKTICYLHPEVKSLHTFDQAFIAIPGIPSLTRDFCPSMEKLHNKLYTFSELWEIFGSHVPFKGRVLRRFLSSNKLYIPGISNTHGFISIRRLNALVSMRMTKRLFEKIKASFLFLFWVFALGTGLPEDKVLKLIYNHFSRSKYAVSDEDILLARPKRNYRITNRRIVEILGEFSKKYFPVKELKEKKPDFTQTIIELANQGLSIRMIAEKLNIHISKVKRIRAKEVKAGNVLAAA